jgi:hypothetical protein
VRAKREGEGRFTLNGETRQDGACSAVFLWLNLSSVRISVRKSQPAHFREAWGEK